MTASKILKNSAYVLSALLLAACQPSPATDEALIANDSTTVDTPLVITDDSVTMAPDYILSIKPSRYQPSIGLQGHLEPVRQTKLVTAYPVNVEEVFVTEGQLIKKDMPLLIVRRVSTAENGASLPTTTNNAGSTSEKQSQEQERVSESGDKQPPESDERSTPKSAQLTTANRKPSISSESDASQPSSSSDANANVNTNASVDIDASAKNKESADNNTNDQADARAQYNLVTIRASFTGRVTGLQAVAGQQLAARHSLLQLNDETKLYFIAALPVQAKPQLSIGQTVNFTAEGKSDSFTGQVSKLTTTSQPKKLLVHVDVIENKDSRTKLLPNLKVTGRLDYGQIDVGTTVPERALHDVDLTELQTSPYKPLRPLTANVWIIGQDQRLMRQPIEVVEYNPTTKQYLIAGISIDSLICMADLPADAEGKRVIVS